MMRMSSRGRFLLALTLMGTLGLLASGCHMTVNFTTRPEATETPKKPGDVKPGEAKPGPVQDFKPTATSTRSREKEGVKPASFEELAAPTEKTKPTEQLPGDKPGLPLGSPPEPLSLTTPPVTTAVPVVPLPSELQKVSHPPYQIEPPDVLIIDAPRMIPRPPYRIEPLDVLTLQSPEASEKQPIAGLYPVNPDGVVALGYGYGTVRVAGLTLEEAQTAIRDHLAKMIRNPQVALGLAQFQSAQQIRGEHLVRQDGTISLGTYGSVYVAGMQLAQARRVIEEYLSRYLHAPQVSVDVLVYNSKAYYVIADGAGFGQRVVKFPITGNETVLDAINNIGGIPAVGSKHSIWVARPAPANHGCLQVLPVDWQAIVQGGATRTNYQLFPGDRVYIKADPVVAFDNAVAKILSPIERMFGVTLLGAATVRTIENSPPHRGVFFGGF